MNGENLEALKAENEKLKNLLVKIATAEANGGSGPDGSAYGFWRQDYPEAPGAFGDTEIEAAIDFLEQVYA